MISLGTPRAHAAGSIASPWAKRIAWLTSLLLAAAAPCLATEPPPFRAARSVHLAYPGPDSVLFYNEVIVDKAVNGSYFCACGWDTGYFGIQQLDSPEDKVVIFSIWDPATGDDPNAVKTEERVEVLYHGDDVRIKRFGGEGTGGQSMWRYRWQSGQTNRFLLQAAIEGQKTAYTAWFHAGESWKKLATFRTRTQGRALSGYYSFIEDFRRDGKSVHEERRARFGNGWLKTAAGEWLPLGEARFTASNSEWESKDNIDSGVAGDRFYLATGGELKQSRKLKTVIKLPAPPATPSDWLVKFKGPK
jgi:hypothetical protein